MGAIIQTPKASARAPEGGLGVQPQRILKFVFHLAAKINWAHAATCVIASPSPGPGFGPVHIQSSESVSTYRDVEPWRFLLSRSSTDLTPHYEPDSVNISHPFRMTTRSSCCSDKAEHIVYVCSYAMVDIYNHEHSTPPQTSIIVDRLLTSAIFHIPPACVSLHQIQGRNALVDSKSIFRF